MREVAAPIFPDIARAGLRGMNERFKTRRDSEHENIVISLVIGSLIVAYLLVSFGVDAFDQTEVLNPLLVAVIGLTIAVGLLLHMLWRPGISHGRRVIAMLMHLGSLSAFMYFGGEVTAPFYPIYLWVTLGNGFRYGVRYLMGAAVLSVAGFAIVTQITPFWLNHPTLSLGLLVGLFVLPAYVSTLIRKLTEAKAQAEQANEAKSRFLATMSHELRTPLNAVIGLTDLLDRSSLDGEQRDMVRSIRAAGRALLDQINDILDLSKIEADRTEIERNELDLHELLADVHHIAGAQARLKGLGFSIQVDPQVPQLLHGDRKHLQDILINLAGNAVKFTDSGDIVLAVAPSAAEDGAPFLRFSVADTGVGIPEDQQRRIFESFTQADDSAGRRFGGTGLGLTISRRLVELMGGRIGVDSESGEGSTFWFTVPLEPGAASEEPLSFDEGQVLLIASGDRAGALGRRMKSAGVEAHTLPSVHDALRELASSAFSRAARPVVILDEVSIGPAGHRIAGTLAADGRSRSPLFIIVLRDAGDLTALNAGRYLSAIHRDDEAVGLYRALRLASRLVREDSTPATQTDPFSKRRQSLRVLLVEDNAVNRQVARKILERAGHSVIEACDGDEALDSLEEDAIDAVLMDLNMPGMSGIEATQLYRASQAGGDEHRLPIVALTADATPAARERCLEAGMDGLLVKPFEPAVLLSLLDRLAGGDVDGVDSDDGTDAGAGVGDPSEEEQSRIARHPRFAEAKSEILDEDKLIALAAIGGDDEFVADVARDFVADTRALVASVQSAVDDEKLSNFRDALHALRSSAANMGAKRLFLLAHSMSGLDRSRLRIEGPAFAATLRAEYEVTAAELDRRYGGAGIADAAGRMSHPA